MHRRIRRIESSSASSNALVQISSKVNYQKQKYYTLAIADPGENPDQMAIAAQQSEATSKQHWNET